MEKEKDSLKIYLFDRVMPIAYVEMVAGLIIAAAPTIILLTNIPMFQDSKGGLNDAGIIMMIAATVLFFVGILITGTGNYKRNLCKHGFLAERDGHVYAFSLNTQRLKDGKTLGVTKVGKLANSINAMDNKAYYTQKMDLLKKSSTFYDEVNKILDDNYSHLYAFKDIKSEKFTSVERKVLSSEYNRLSQMEKIS